MVYDVAKISKEGIETIADKYNLIREIHIVNMSPQKYWGRILLKPFSRISIIWLSKILERAKHKRFQIFRHLSMFLVDENYNSWRSIFFHLAWSHTLSKRRVILSLPSCFVLLFFRLRAVGVSETTAFCFMYTSLVVYFQCLFAFVIFVWKSWQGTGHWMPTLDLKPPPARLDKEIHPTGLLQLGFTATFLHGYWDWSLVMSRERKHMKVFLRSLAIFVEAPRAMQDFDQKASYVNHYKALEKDNCYAVVWCIAWRQDRRRISSLRPL